MNGGLPTTLDNPIGISRSRVGVAAVNQPLDGGSQSFETALSVLSQGQSISENYDSSASVSSGGACPQRSAEHLSEEKSITDTSLTDAVPLLTAVCFLPVSGNQPPQVSPIGTMAAYIEAGGSPLPESGVATEAAGDSLLGEQVELLTGQDGQLANDGSPVQTAPSRGQSSAVDVSDLAVKSRGSFPNVEGDRVAVGSMQMVTAPTTEGVDQAVIPIGAANESSDPATVSLLLKGSENSSNELWDGAMEGRPTGKLAVAGWMRSAQVENSLHGAASPGATAQSIDGGQAAPEVNTVVRDKATGLETAGSAAVNTDAASNNDTKSMGTVWEATTPEVMARGTEATNTSVEAPAIKPRAAEAVSQIVRHAEILVRGGQKEVHVHLDPPSLGRVSLLITTNQETISIQLLTETPEVRDMVQANLPQLVAALKDQGIDVDQLSVHLGSALFDFEAEGGNRQPTSNDSAQHSPATGEEETAPEAADRVSSINYWRESGQCTVDYLA